MATDQKERNKETLVNGNNEVNKEVNSPELQELVSLTEKVLEDLTDMQTNNIFVKKETEIKYEPPDQEVTEEQMVSDRIYHEDDRVVRECETNIGIVGTVQGQSILISLGPESTRTTPLYCKTCNQNFCTESIFLMHQRVHLRLQLCSCDICDSTNPPPDAMPSTKLNTSILKTNDKRKQNLLMQQNGFLSGSHGKENPSQTAIDTSIKQEPVKIDDGERMEVLEDVLRMDMSQVNQVATPLAPPAMYTGFALDVSHSSIVGEGPTLYRCGVCYVTYTARDELMTHIQLHMTPIGSNLDVGQVGHTGPSSAAAPPQYTCGIYNGTYSKRNQLKAHVREQQRHKPHICEICSRQFTKADGLKRHVEAVHTLEKHQCDQCNKLYSSVLTLSRHKKDYCKAGTNVGPFFCDRCNKEYSTKTTMIQHKTFDCYDKTQDMPFKCDLCDNKYPHPRILKFHKSKVHKLYTCDYCNRNFYNRFHLQRHFQVHTGVKPFTCKICNKQFGRKYRLQLHEKSHTEAGSFVCDVCERRFYDCHHLKRHKQKFCNEKVFKEKPYLCDVCKRRFVNKTVITRHIINNHLYILTCNVCNKSFGTMYKLKFHMETHINRKNMRCDICRNKFTKITQLLKHERMHQDADTKYVCDRCDKKFIHYTTLIYHNQACLSRAERVSNKLYQCDICDECFSTNYILSRHREKCKKFIRKHPYQCDVCKRRYRTKTNISEHITNCHSKQYHCDTCNKEFMQKGK